MLNQGQILDGKYEIIKVLGQGGMSTVYLCRNNRLGNLWALKEINSEWNSKIDFLAEPNILKNLNHNGIVRIIDIFHENNSLYIVEDYIEGKTLKDHVEINGPLAFENIVEISLQLCNILSYLHSHNPPIIYRDLKPSNIMIKPNNKIVLIDFGIARIYKEGQNGDTVILGSKGYIAPEQLVNIQSNAQTDIYSLGITIYFMLTGKSISLPTEVMFNENYPQSSNKNLKRIIQKASSIQPENRYKDINQILIELNRAYEEDSYERTRLMNSIEKSSLISSPKKKSKFVIIGILACIIAAAIWSAMLLNNMYSSSRTEKKETKTEIKQDTQPIKETVEKDTNVTGVLDSSKPFIISTGSTKGKNKDKNQNSHVKFALNPAAAISNSNFSIALTHIETIEDDVIAILSTENKTSAAIKLDLSKTFLLNQKKEAKKCYNPNSETILAIPQSSGKQEIKLYFKDFDFEGSTFTLKTTLNFSIAKDINLYISVK
jgi:serine/threonine protein kinase